jgi:DNA ligase D-like protein (predicted polymerase)
MAPHTTLEVAGREVTVTNPDKVYFPAAGIHKIDVVRYYLSVADGALAGTFGRPMALKRYVNGIEGQAFYQKRAPETRPEWIETVELKYPSGRSAHEVVLRDAAQLAWIANLGCLDLHPHSVRADDLEHPDELRVDLDPIPGVGWPDVRSVALVVHEVLTEHGLVGWPKTSGSRGMHIYVRVRRDWTFPEVRRAGIALAREVERRVPELATSRWWKEERHGVFIDYNQNAKDRTTTSAYSVRPTPDARVSTPLAWAEVADCDPADFTLATVPGRVKERGDLGAGIDAAIGDLGSLLALAAEQAEAGLDDPPEAPARDEDIPARRPAKKAPAKKAAAAKSPTGRRKSTMPLIEIARSKTVDEANAALDHWKQRWPAVVPLLEPADILTDSMRGRSSTWTRIRVNLQHVPEADRPPQEPLEVDFDPWAGMSREE